MFSEVNPLTVLVAVLPRRKTLNVLLKYVNTVVGTLLWSNSE